MTQEPEWTDRQLERFGDLCRRRWGLRFTPADRESLRSRVERAFDVSGAGSLDEFVRMLASAPDTAPEVQAFVSQIAVGETSFFRNRPQFIALTNRILPRLVAERSQQGDRSLRIWSAGCSTGEEPYSIAIAIAMCVTDWKEWDVEILATDVNPFALRRASEAIYSNWSFRDVDPASLPGFFESAGKTQRLIHPCRSLVRFRTLNLATATIPDPSSGLSAFDVIFCRNVMLYFDRALMRRLSDGFFEALVPGGWLFVGHTEPDAELFATFELREFPDTSVYRKPSVKLVSPGLDSPEERDAPRQTDHFEETAEFPSAPAELDVALGAYDAGDLDSAYEILLAMHRAGSPDPIPTHLLAQVCVDRGHFNEALYWAYSALHRDPFHVATLLLMGVVQIERDEPQAALECIRRAIFLEPTSPEAHFYLSLAQRASGDGELADRSQERAARLCATAPSETPLLPIQRTRRALCSS